MKEKIKNFLKNPILKSIISLIFSVFGFLLVRFDETSTIDGLISGLGLVVFCFSLFSLSFSLCEAVSLISERKKNKKELKGKEK